MPLANVPAIWYEPPPLAAALVATIVIAVAVWVGNVSVILAGTSKVPTINEGQLATKNVCLTWAQTSAAVFAAAVDAITSLNEARSV